MKEEDSRLETESLAGLIIDVLVDAGYVKEEDFEEAVKIAALEINIQKSINDL